MKEVTTPKWFRLIQRREAFRIQGFSDELSGTLSVVYGANNTHETKARVVDVVFLDSDNPLHHSDIEQGNIVRKLWEIEHERDAFHGILSEMIEQLDGDPESFGSLDCVKRARRLLVQRTS